MKDYKIGISLIGIISVVLVMAPNIIYLFAAPPNDVLSSNDAKFVLWNVIENIGRYGTMITLCAVVNKKDMRKNRFLDIFALCSLFIYFALWVIYFNGVFSGISLAGMAIFPTIFFSLVAWKLRNKFALYLSILFAIAHIGITCSNFLF